MSAESFPKLLIILGFGLAGYVGLNVYSQPVETYSQIEPICMFLNSALARDTAALARQASNEQPIRWVLEATRLDSLAVREWAESRPGSRVHIEEILSGSLSAGPGALPGARRCIRWPQVSLSTQEGCG